jgi:hypothetical protein
MMKEVILNTELGVRVGWLDSTPDEDPAYYCWGRNQPEIITHWMSLPDQYQTEYFIDVFDEREK